MVHKSINNLKKNKKGVTLIEVVFVVFVVGLFSMIMISNFPLIQKRFALSRVSYKLAQDIRRTQNLGTSGTNTLDSNGDAILVQGYGIYAYVNAAAPFTDKYIIYADVDGRNFKYSGFQPYEDNYCADMTAPSTDCVVEIIDIGKSNPGMNIYIKELVNGDGEPDVSINFAPPTPLVSISSLLSYKKEIGIVLGIVSDNASKTVYVNRTGLVSVQ